MIVLTITAPNRDLTQSRLPSANGSMDPISCFGFVESGQRPAGKAPLRKVSRDSRLQHHLNRWAPEGTVKLADMFFTTEGTELQRSREGLLRSLLFQVLAEPTLAIQVSNPFLSKTPNHRGKITWTWAKLRSAFHELLGLASETQRFCFFIDGLDELTTSNAHPPEFYFETDNEQGRKIRAGHRHIAELLLSVARDGYVKVCVSSRPSNQFQAVCSQCPTFQLELLTKRDVKKHSCELK